MRNEAETPVRRTHSANAPPHASPDRFLYPGGGTLTWDIRKGLVHAMWGTLNVLTGRIDTFAVWSLVSMIGSVSILLMLFCAGSILMGSAAVGLIAVFLFLLIYNGGLANYQLITLAYAFSWRMMERLYNNPTHFIPLYRTETAALTPSGIENIYIKAHETIRGGCHRLTTTHLPLGGIYPPDRWQSFRVTRDRWTITVPPDLSPGLYRVGVKLLVITQYPNYTIRDFLNDQDSIAGVVMAEVIVE